MKLADDFNAELFDSKWPTKEWKESLPDFELLEEAFISKQQIIEKLGYLYELDSSQVI